MGHELGTLIGDDDMRQEFVSVHAYISEEKLKATLRDFFGRRVAWEKAHQARSGINSAAVTSVPMRVTGEERPLEV